MNRIQQRSVDSRDGMKGPFKCPLYERGRKGWIASQALIAVWAVFVILTLMRRDWGDFFLSLAVLILAPLLAYGFYSVLKSPKLLWYGPSGLLLIYERRRNQELFCAWKDVKQAVWFKGSPLVRLDLNVARTPGSVWRAEVSVPAELYQEIEHLIGKDKLVRTAW